MLARTHWGKRQTIQLKFLDLQLMSSKLVCSRLSLIGHQLRDGDNRKHLEIFSRKRNKRPQGNLAIALLLEWYWCTLDPSTRLLYKLLGIKLTTVIIFTLKYVQCSLVEFYWLAIVLWLLLKKFLNWLKLDCDYSSHK